MKLVPVGLVGLQTVNEVQGYKNLITDIFQKTLLVLLNGKSLKPIQRVTFDRGLLLTRRNILVATPTNSGKTLIGYLILLEALANGKRAVLLEPLRALAREKADELEKLAPALGEAIGRPFALRVSTGDYRLENETFADPAPGAELIIATPERLESILRAPENQNWFTELGAVCVDEAHLISEPRRGATLEYLITSLLCLPAPPRLVLLSATLGGTDTVADWLAPCDVITVTERTPPLDKWLAELTPGEDANAGMADWLQSELATPGAQALVFIYQARHTASTATQLTQRLGDRAGPAGALPYHSKLPPAQRDQVRSQFLSGACRVVVTTSALALGVNLPATHVVVRDLTYPGARSPSVAELLQMMGRAGRGDRPGKALVLKRPTDEWSTPELVEALRRETLPPLTSALALSERACDFRLPPATEAVASLLLRAGTTGKTVADLETFFQRSLGGRAIVAQIPAALRWLNQQRLAYHDETTDHHHLTVLGDGAVRSVLPLTVAAGFGWLMRDLLSLGEDDHLLGRWTPLDTLLVLELLHDDTPTLRKFGAELTGQVESWCEGHSAQVPLLFRRWLRGGKGHANAAEVIGSLGLEPARKVADRDEWARQRGYLATFNAVVLHERAQGRSLADLERQYGLTNLEGVEERWRDTHLWLLAGIARLLDVRAFYYHLREECGADLERVKRVKRHLGAMHRQMLELIEQIKFASPLGALVLTLRRRKGKAGVGVDSIRRLEEAGLTQVAQVARLSADQLAGHGVRKDIARRIVNHLKAMAV